MARVTVKSRLTEGGYDLSRPWSTAITEWCTAGATRGPLRVASPPDIPEWHSSNLGAMVGEATQRGQGNGNAGSYPYPISHGGQDRWAPKSCCVSQGQGERHRRPQLVSGDGVGGKEPG